MNILGVSCHYHDSAASLVKDGVLIAAAEEERFTRKKHDNTFPTNAIQYCLKEGKITADEIDVVAFYDKPMLKFDRILHTCVSTFPKSFWMFWDAVPQWMTEKLRVPSLLKNKIGYKGEVLFIEHHKSHAASAFFVSPFKESAIVTIDGIGEWTSAAIHYGKDNDIETLKEIRFPHSLGLFYSTITSYLGFKVNNDEYKIMGLAAYGKPAYYDKFKNIVDVKEDGSFNLNMKYFSYTHDKKMFSNEFEREFGPRREYESKITKRHKDIASTLQKLTEEIMLKIANYAHSLTGSENLCMAGGVALNCVANGRIIREGPFKRVFIQPAATDAGGSLGAAFYAYNKIYENRRKYVMTDAYLGPSFVEAEIKDFLENSRIEYERMNKKKLLEKIAHIIAEDKIVGWFQGRLEFGPRALGNRSILANPKNPKMKDILNKKVKHREPFRPFAPSILLRNAKDYLVGACDSPFMILAFDVKRDKIKDIISATHIDGTCRPQTVTREENKLYYDLIKKFSEITGVPAVINTSFNVRGEPIVCTHIDAFNTFVKTDIDYLVLGNYIISKEGY